MLWSFSIYSPLPYIKIVHFFLHSCTCCVIWKEQTQALNLVLQLISLHGGMPCSKFLWQQWCCVKSYSKFSWNFQILSAEKSWADIAKQFPWKHAHSFFICFLHLLYWTLWTVGTLEKTALTILSKRRRVFVVKQLPSHMYSHSKTWLPLSCSPNNVRKNI